MSKDLIRYDLMVQDALKSVLRKLLTEAARDGLPGEHHFYITFRTEAPGVRLSQRMREKYPEEMTVVLQHQFWDLGVTEHAFEVGLSFGGIPERLLVPFESITGFFDPSVNFGLKFELQEGTDAGTAKEPPAQKRPQLASVPTEALPAPATARKSLAKSSKLTESPEDDTQQADTPLPKANVRKGAAKPAGKARQDTSQQDTSGQDISGQSGSSGADNKDAPGQNPDGKGPAGKDSPAKDSGAQIVSLDAFRKKT
jgi:uncharacterized protein